VSPSLPKFKLAGARGDGRHPYANSDGAFIGLGVPLLERDALGRWRPRDEAILERLLGTGYGVPVALGRRTAQLCHVAESLNNGNLALACISLVRMQLPPLPSAGHALAMAKADGLVGKYNPDLEDEPRVPAGNPDGGQWTSEGGDTGDDASPIVPAAARVDETQAKKERFVDAHFADAQTGADQLGVPVENILGLSALESQWGEHPFAAKGNNFFGIHYPAPFATGYLPARDNPRVRVATFASYADSLRSFVARYGSIVQGLADPTDFAAALWNSGKFGVGNPTYVSDVARTLRGLRSIVSRRRI
jgi:hypothetical protein